MNELDRLRADTGKWESVAFAPCQTDERGTYDGNAQARLRLLLTLQYDCRDADADLVRYLFTNEIEAAKNDSFQGCGEGLKLAAFLLARFREPSDARLFARAKIANFDTACGFPAEFIPFAGGQNAERIVNESDPALWERLASSFDLSITPENLDEWWRSINEDYPDSEQGEHLLSLYERALSFDDSDRAIRYLEQWAAEEPESRSKRSQLKHEYARLGDFRRAAEIATNIVDRTDTPWDRASSLVSLVKLQRQAGEFALSLSTARQLDTTFAAFDEWIGVGLGRMAIHEVFELSLSYPETVGARDAFSLADCWFQQSRDLALVGMESGAKAAKRCNLADKVIEYERMATVERNRIDDMMAN